MAAVDSDTVPLLRSTSGDSESQDGEPAPVRGVRKARNGHCHRVELLEAQLDQASATRKARQKLIVACVLCLLFMIGEAIGGILAGSLALMTDAAHMLSDFAGFLISLFAIWVAQRPATKTMSFGFYRAEVMGALASVLLIWILTGILVYQAIERLRTGEHKIDAGIMLVTAAVGVAMNVFLAFVLHQHSGPHGHSHGHSHSHSHSHSRVQRVSVSIDEDEEELVINDQDVIDKDVEVGRDVQEQHTQPKAEEKNINVRAAFIHVLGDMVQSVGVLIAAYIIYYYPRLTYIDPICTFLFSVLVLLTTLRIFRDALHILMEGSPRGVSYEEVKEDLENINGVKMAHGLHIWCLTLGRIALAVHLVIDPGSSHRQQEILVEAQQLVREKYNMQHTTIQVEMYHVDMEDCKRCQNPVG